MFRIQRRPAKFERALERGDEAPVVEVGFFDLTVQAASEVRDVLLEFFDRVLESRDIRQPVCKLEGFWRSSSSADCLL